jgi:ATP-dependent DNA helicase DinG
MNQRFVIIDIETTGNTPKKGDRIIQLAAVVVENEQVVEAFQSLVRPDKQIPEFIEELTGINDELVKNAPTFKDIAPTVWNLLHDSVFVAHNALFDLTFLNHEMEKVGYPSFNGNVIDTVELAKITYPTLPSYKLIDLAAHFGFQHDRPHQADSDALVTAQLFIEFYQKLNRLPLVTIKQLKKFAKYLKSDLWLLFETIDENRILSNDNTYKVIRGIALKNNEKNSLSEKKEAISTSIGDQKHLVLKKAIPNYRHRKGQLEMMNVIERALHHQQHAVIEAGTGVGKTIAYLLPAANFALQTGEKIVISTHTVQLQTQLMEKEVQWLNEFLPLRVHVLKGKTYYIDLFKFEQTLTELDTTYDHILAKMQILVWLTETETGDVDELSLSSGGKLFWNRIKHYGWEKAKQRNEWKEHDFYLRALKKAENAHIIVTNHAFLLQNSLKGTMPPFKYVIIDEAHHLPKVASHFFGEQISYAFVKYHLGLLGSYEQQQLLRRFEDVVEKYGFQPTKHPFEVVQLVQNLSQEVDELFTIIGNWMRRSWKVGKGKLRIQLHDWESETWKTAKLIAERIIFMMNELEEDLNERLALLEGVKTNLSDGDYLVFNEGTVYLEECQRLKEQLTYFFTRTGSSFIQWAEGDERALPNSIQLNWQPLYVEEKMYALFFAEKLSVIMTSATLTINQSFNFFLSQLGVSEREIAYKKIIPSPFSYKENARLIVPNDVPSVRDVSMEEYCTTIASQLIGIAQATKGRMLILFTSYDMLKKTYELMKESQLLDQYVLLAQGVSGGSAQRLTKLFRSFDKAILFGTSTFWEGIDIPGEDLSCLCIVRLPFSPPDEPFHEAMCERVQQEGKNSFYYYSLPEAVIRFKQGFGRLLRHETDRGLVIVFDQRIVQTKYGETFLASIPQVPVYELSIAETISFIHQWL